MKVFVLNLLFKGESEEKVTYFFKKILLESHLNSKNKLC